MKTDFKDHFSTNSQEYKQFRPRYPLGLFEYLASITREHKRAWDCGTGTGQAALCLSDYYSEVIATDASRAQIEKATTRKGMIYTVSPAERTAIETSSTDLITVAQALHWFNIAAFTTEVDRVLKSGGVLAIWTYNLMNIRPDVDEIINHLYGTVLMQYWPEERTMVEQTYQGISFPFREIQPPAFRMTQEWNLPQLVGYLHTWSAVKEYEKDVGQDPIASLQDQLAECWDNPESPLSVNWPLTVRAWIKDM